MTTFRKDHPGWPVASGFDGTNAWAEVYHDGGPTRFEEQAEEGEAEAVSRKLESKAVELARQREKAEVEQVRNQALVHQLISVLEQGAFDACSSEQKAHVRQLIATKKVEKQTHE